MRAESLDEIVTVPSADGLELRARLRIPACEPGGSVPAAVLVAGSGPQSMDAPLRGALMVAYGFEARPFRDLAEDLSDRGVASLRYDKRTCGPFNGCADNGYPAERARDATFDHFVADAVAAFDFVADHPLVDSERVAVVGHSQGALVAVHVAARRPRAHGVAFLAGSLRSPRDLLEQQAAELRSRLNPLPEQARPAVDAIERLAAELRDGLASGVGDARMMGGAPLGFWRSWHRAADRAEVLLPGLRRPMVAIFGGLDFNVPPAVEVPWLEERARSAQVIVHDELTHGLIAVRDGHPEPRASAVVVDALAGLLQAEGGR